MKLEKHWRSFSNFTGVSISTASFAQVYKGMYKGDVVIIKIQNQK